MLGSRLDLAAVFDRLPNAFMVIDRDLRFVAANAAYLATTGSNLESLLGRGVFEAFPAPPEHVAELTASFERVLALGTSDELAAIVYTLGQVERVWSVRHTPIVGDDGRVAYIAQELIVVRAQDVAAARRAEARRQFLIEVVPNQVWTSTPDGRLDFVSNRAVAYFQRTAEQILGDGWLAVLHPDDVMAVVERWTHSLTTGAPYEVEFRLRRGDGEYRWHLGRANAELDAGGVILQWIGTNTDVHDAKVALADLTARSEYEQRLIGIVSHDLRNPFNVIGLGTSALAQQELSPAVQRIVARMARASERAVRLIDDLMTFARARIGSTIPVNPRPTNLREIVEQVVDELHAAAPGRMIRIDHAGDETGSWDADRLAQVISNLVGNALQHGTPGSPVVIASRITGDHATLEVSNDGPGIPQHEVATLFEPYRRGSAPGDARGSMGLGLYIAREVIVAHGGTIQVDSQPHATTRFTVRLPRYATAGA